MQPSPIIYTHTDEAPLLATYSFLPIIAAYAGQAGVAVETRDISLAGRIIAQFPERLTDDQRLDDALAELGALAKRPEANIIKLPNVSASMPQLKAAIAELQSQGYDLPDYPDNPSTDEEKDARARYDRVKGSAVNPVLREGNSDRRAADSVKQYARKHPHSMGAWSADSKTNVATMGEHDFKSNEKSVVLEADDTLRIEHEAADGTVTVLKDAVPVLAGEIVDGTVLQVAHLHAFLANAIARAKADDVLFSVHLKATMMKVSDPIIFGHVVTAFFPEVFATYGDKLAAAGLSPSNGLGGILAGLDALDDGAEIKAAFEAGIAAGPALAMVDSDRGITNLHVPSDVIVDASMPAMIRTSGHMWGPDGQEADTLAVIPDSSYAGVYQDSPRRLPRPRRVRPDHDGLGAQRRADGAGRRGVRLARQDLRGRRPPGTVRVVNAAGDVLLEHDVEAGDIWRACQTKDVPVRDWVKLAVTRARATGAPGGLLARRDPRPRRQPDRQGARATCPSTTPTAWRSRSWRPQLATAYSLERIRKGEDTISVTGNVLRDYLTDLFPILELGTSAKMLSIVPLIAGGGLFETGAGGSAPKHVQQLVKENYLRWDSLGEFLALAESFGKYARRPRQPAREDPGRDARPGHRHLPRPEQQPRPQGRLDRQPRLPLLPRALLGAGAGAAGRRPGAGGGVRAASRSGSRTTRRRSPTS